MAMIDKRYSPDWLELQDLWMQTHFAGKPAIVISNTVSTAEHANFEVIAKFVNLSAFFGSRFSVCECSELESFEILQILRGGGLFAMFWNGNSFTNET